MANARSKRFNPFLPSPLLFFLASFLLGRYFPLWLVSVQYLLPILPFSLFLSSHLRAVERFGGLGGRLGGWLISVSSFV
jgi:hypothetical protein